MKEYLRAARRIAKEIKKSCQSTWTLAHASRPVNANAKRLSGSGFSRSPQLISNMRRWSFPKLSPLSPDPIPCSCSFSLSLGSLFNNPSLFSANNIGNLGSFLEIRDWILGRKEMKLRFFCEESRRGLRVERIGGAGYINGGGCEVEVGPNMSRKWKVSKLS